MTDIAAKIIADSISPAGKRLRTAEMHMPRIILAEFNTHRQLSRNTRSSRAVPIEKIIEEVQTKPFIPIHWGAAQKGMQAYAQNNAPVEIALDYDHLITLDNEKAWLFARDRMVEVAIGFKDAGYHKQVVNRLLEPWMFVDTLATATEWTNFLGLRDHHMAEPHIRKLAQEVKAAMAASEPKMLRPGEWHLPYVTDTDRQLFPLDTWIKVSVARCARISYTPFDGNGSIEKELERYDLLVGSSPLHASPAEHQATPDTPGYDASQGRGWWMNPKEHGNFVGWRQYRKTLPGEHISEAA